MKTLKKLSAVLLSVMLLAALLPANLAFAGSNDKLPVYYNFGDCVIADSSSDFSIHNATYKISTDSVYGKTLKVSGESGKIVQIRYRGTADTCYSANGSLTIKTAIKKYDKNIDTGLRFGVVSAVQPIAFNTDGYIYIAGEKTSYTYDANVWYEVTMTVNHNSGYTESIINGGSYKNLVLSGYSEELIQAAEPSTKNRAYIGAYNGGATDATTFELGYFSVSAGSLTNTQTTAEASFTEDFENAIVSEGAVGRFTNGTATYISSVNDDVYGKVLKVVGGNTYGSMPELPLTGTHILSMSVKTATGAIIYLRNTTQVGSSNQETTLLKFNTSGNIEAGGSHIKVDDENVSYVNDRWYDVKFTLNMEQGKYSVIVTDTVTGENITASDLTLTKITGDGNTPRLRLKTDGSSSPAAYYDSISLSVAGETARLQSITPAPAATGVMVSAEPTVLYSQKLDASTVNTETVAVTVNGEAYSDYDAKLSADGRSIVITHTNPLVENTKFTVNINGVKNIAGTAITAYTYSFTTAKAYEIGDVTFSGAAAGEAGNVTANVNIKFNDNAKHEVAFILAAYDGESGELSAFNFANTKGVNAVEGSGTLSATVENIPAGAKVYAYLWENLATLRPYIPAVQYIATPIQ